MTPTEVSEWSKFCKLESSYGFASFGFHPSATHGDAYRFGARYSLAADLSTVAINGRTQNTSDGYAQLMKTVMAWGVVESYFSLHNIKIGHPSQRNLHLVPTYDVVKLTALKSKLNNQQCFKFFTELKLHVNNSHQSAISDYLANPLGSYDVSYLFSAIRHVFAHGILTPHTGKVAPRVTVRICKALVEFFLDIVSDEFGKKVRLHSNYASI
ncbi:hypothetical protein NDJ15_00055 [Vibrio parahaemolyticus]|uniref:hypothetical protein n=1 Tax=Vibrio TaxID=662 RepID=UPI000541AB36|nr:MULTISPECIES: hypothetical protein [Vibrio harveyi group]EHH2479581.1 hypothetical protein [Vibrio vulnificus]EJE3289556.1 hypothetical protein [Vibrio alginolyticus]APP04927.1 hypothetical protein BG259_06045 [Vibrio harveyi]EGR3159714.1 hypothetical protein [Vibrio parahaemolyticus]EHH2488986.1 hypothetical protein [Vibrio vulnificus]